MEVKFKHITNEILSLISKTEHELKIALAWFTNSKLLDEVLMLIEKGIDVTIILNYDQINCGEYSLDWNRFIELGGKLYFWNSKSLMHNKFVILDDKFVINGSFNWTYNAEYRNAENITISENKQLISKFTIQFNKLLESSIIAKKPILKIVNIKEPKQLLYIKKDLISKSESNYSDGNKEESKKILDLAKSILKGEHSTDKEIDEVSKRIAPEYYYHIEDGQFWSYFTHKKLLASEGDTIEYDVHEIGDKIKFYILYIDDHHVECIGNIERVFPKNKQEHNEIKERTMRQYGLLNEDN